MFDRHDRSGKARKFRRLVLTRLAHSMADTLITPLNDSFVDFDVLGRWIRKPMRSPETAIMRRWSATPAGSGASWMAS